MCGIAGVYNFADHQPVDPALLLRMCQVIRHRGPDDQGLYQQGDFGMGMRRLSIIDVAGGHQPVFNEDGSIGIVFNGEIYNYRQLMAHLQKKKHIFKTNSDTETILHLYEELSDDCLTHLRGMFAFAIWDRPRRRLLLARDRVGKKPLYYWLDGRRCVFASEIKAILQDPDVDRRLNREALIDYLTFLCVPWPKTIFQGIWKLPPASLAVVTPEGLRVSQYWDLPAPQDVSPQSPSEICQDLLTLLKDCVACRLESEVPLGAFLSGGIDSSTVVALMAGLADRPVTSVSIGFPERDYDELPYAGQVAGRFHTCHFTHLVRPEALPVVEKLVWHFDEPFADSSAVPTYYVCQAAREHVTVALSGDGGDEAFGGYRRYFYDLVEHRIRDTLPRFVRHLLVSPLAELYPKADRLPQFLRAKTLLANLTVPAERGYCRSRSIFHEPMRRSVLRREVLEDLGPYDPFSVLEPHFQRTRGWPHLSRLQYVDLKTYLPDDILVKVDRMSMANSLEVRSPFLDHQLWEYLAGISPRLKIRGTQRKYILKKAVSGLVPQQILRRRKRGFVVPLAEWFRGSAREFSRQVLLESNQAGSDLFDHKFIDGLWQDHQSGRRNYATPLWTLLMFQLWHRQYQGSR